MGAAACVRGFVYALSMHVRLHVCVCVFEREREAAKEVATTNEYEATVCVIVALHLCALVGVCSRICV